MATRTPARPAGPVPPQPLPHDARARLAAAAPGAAPRRRLGDPRGLTPAGAVALVLVVAVPALAVDLLLGGGPGALYGVVFPVACALAALGVHREALRAAVLMPPLLYAGLALLTGLLGAGLASGGRSQQLAGGLADALVYQAPVLWAATAAAALVALRRRASGGR